MNYTREQFSLGVAYDEGNPAHKALRPLFEQALEFARSNDLFKIAGIRRVGRAEYIGPRSIRARRKGSDASLTISFTDKQHGGTRLLDIGVWKINGETPFCTVRAKQVLGVPGSPLSFMYADTDLDIGAQGTINQAVVIMSRNTILPLFKQWIEADIYPAHPKTNSLRGSRRLRPLIPDIKSLQSSQTVRLAQQILSGELDMKNNSWNTFASWTKPLRTASAS